MSKADEWPVIAVFAVRKPLGASDKTPVIRQNHRVYGFMECNLLARYEPKQTILTADTYALFTVVS